jgi:hypothetical protein
MMWGSDDDEVSLTLCVEIAAIVLLFLDLLFNFNTGFYNSGDIILDRVEISKRYLRTMFPSDLISLLGLLIPVFYGNSLLNDNLSTHTCGLRISWVYALKLFFLFKVQELLSIFRILEEVVFNDEKYENILSLIKLFLEMLIVAHFIACFWNYVAEFESPTNWRSLV